MYRSNQSIFWSFFSVNFYMNSIRKMWLQIKLNYRLKIQSYFIFIVNILDRKELMYNLFENFTLYFLFMITTYKNGFDNLQYNYLLYHII